ncbi:hypothetical protein T10_4029 [Trichinella papuae]|uniref:Uncharacterized protein n=1 Tax=Trichinella papuae TaxID=268474 RepID=A0A0V1MYD6_9BILA|nr:hypothetical protein T10_4029 [Trichinella papuae]
MNKNIGTTLHKKTESNFAQRYSTIRACFGFQTTAACQFGIVNDGAGANGAERQCGQNPSGFVRSKSRVVVEAPVGRREAPTLDSEDVASFAVANQPIGWRQCSPPSVGSYFLLACFFRSVRLFGKLAVIRPLPVFEMPKLIYLQYVTYRARGRQVRRQTKLNGKHGKGFHGDLTRIEHTVRSG